MVCLVIGDANADLAASLECFPHEGDDAAITALGYYSGGTGANVAVAHARLGGYARLLARVGMDPSADIALHAARGAGVDLSFLQRDLEKTTGLCLAAISPNGERTFFSHRGANVALEMPDAQLVFRDVRHLHLSAYALLDGPQRQTTLTLLDIAHRNGISTSIDLCLPYVRKYLEEISSLAPRLSIVFANAAELVAFGKSIFPSSVATDCISTAISKILDAGAEFVAAKLGGDGSLLAFGSSRIDIAPFSINAADTTGAGDAFVAAFLFAMHKGAEPEVAAEIGNAVGALVASRRGAGNACPSRDEVYALLKSRGTTKALDAFQQSAIERQS